jgi:hypothetical protein
MSVIGTAPFQAEKSGVVKEFRIALNSPERAKASGAKSSTEQQSYRIRDGDVVWKSGRLASLFDPSCFWRA